MTSTHESGDTHAFELEIRIAARPETVFALFVDRAAFADWMGGGMGAATIEPEVGGAVRVDYGGGWKIASGRVLALEAPSRFSFTWGYEDGKPFEAGATRVDITVEPAPGGSLVRLRHSGLPSEKAAQDHGGGWRLYTGILADRAAKAEHAARLPTVLSDWFAAWAEPDADARIATLRRCVTDDAAFRHPMALTVGPDALCSHITSSRMHMQGMDLGPAGPHEQVHQHVRFPWQVTKDGAVVATGVNVARVAPDGRLAEVVGFTDQAPPGRNPS